MSMTQPLSGDNSVLGMRGIGVDGSVFFDLSKGNPRCRAKRFHKLSGIARLGGL
jgi:hypothetical protein